jgi:hypothetical protein
VRLTDDFNIHSSVSPAQPTNISCAGLTWPCHIYSSVNRWICHVYSSVTDEYTRQGHVARPKYIHQVTNEYTWASKSSALYFPSLLCLVSKRPHATVAFVVGLGRRRPCPEPASPLPGPRPQPPAEGRPLPSSFFYFWGIFRYLVIFRYYLGI